MKKNYKPN